MSEQVSPIHSGEARTPDWMLNIQSFDALEIHPCAVVAIDGDGTEVVEQCEPECAHFWTVYGHYRAGGVDAFEDFANEAEAVAFHDRLISIYPHLAGKEG